jgi:hypothetical protein
MANSYRTATQSAPSIVDTERRIASLGDFIAQLKDLDKLRQRVKTATLQAQGSPRMHLAAKPPSEAVSRTSCNQAAASGETRH